MRLFLKKIKQIVILLSISLLCISCSDLPSTNSNPWRVLTLPTEAIFADIAFTDNPDHGWLVGTQATIFETQDKGDTWEAKTIDFGEENISFTSVSFDGEEGWIVGKSSILLHTEDGGENWSRILLSAKLPGAPEKILALGPSSAEMATDIGAIYKTVDGGKTWQALVEGSVGVARNITRSPQGKYVAVSARGNFYSTWEPGQTEWTPHQRTSSRRLQNMGFSTDERLWLLARGGQMQFSEPEDFENWEEAIYPEPSTSWGLLDVAYRTSEDIWVTGGSANLLYSSDGGKTWQKDRDVEDIPSNLYKVVFVNSQQGFILGERGILLKYEPSVDAA